MSFTKLMTDTEVKSKNQPLSRKSISKEMITMLEKFILDEKIKSSVNVATNMILLAINEFNHLDEEKKTKQVDGLRTLLLNFYNDKNLTNVFLKQNP